MPAYGLDTAIVRAIVETQLDFLDTHEYVLDASSIQQRQPLGLDLVADRK